MGILFTILMGFLFTITIGFLFTIVLGIQLSISKYRTDHILTYPLGLFFTLCSNLTVHIESSMLPEQYPLYKIPVDQLFAKEQQEDLAGEKPAEQRIVEA